MLVHSSRSVSIAKLNKMEDFEHVTFLKRLGPRQLGYGRGCNGD